MANNIVISYDLIEPGKNYEGLIAEIKKLGGWARIHYSLWYTKTDYNAGEVVDILSKRLDSNDKLFVVDATNNNAAWNTLSSEVADFLKDKWNSKVAV